MENNSVFAVEKLICMDLWMEMGCNILDFCKISENMIAGAEGWVEMEEGIRGINGNEKNTIKINY